MKNYQTEETVLLVETQKTQNITTQILQPHNWKYRILQFFLFSSGFLSYCSIFCFHAFLSISTPLLVKSRVLSVREISIIVIVAKLSRILPKLFIGGVIDFIGGRSVYIISHSTMGFALILCSIKTSANQFYWIMILLSLGTVGSAMPWPALLKMGTNWFDYRSMGQVMAGISLSILIGDSICRLYLGMWVRFNVNWNTLFLVAGVTMLMVNFFTSFFLYDSPVDFNFQEPEGDPRNILGEEGLKSGIQKDEIWDTFIPILKNPSIWILAIVYTGLTFMRYIANDWIVLYFVVRTNSSNETAASISSIPPLFGAVSVFIMGFLNDRLPTILRNLTLLVYSFVCLGICSIFYFQTIGTSSNDFYLSIILFSSFSFFVIGPYSLPAAGVRFSFQLTNSNVCGIRW
jgi:sugar phosphate permease